MALLNNWVHIGCVDLETCGLRSKLLECEKQTESYSTHAELALPMMWSFSIAWSFVWYMDKDLVLARSSLYVF